MAEPSEYSAPDRVIFRVYQSRLDIKVDVEGGFGRNEIKVNRIGIESSVKLLRTRLAELSRSYVNGQSDQSTAERLLLLRDIASEGDRIRSQLVPKNCLPSPSGQATTIVFKLQDDVDFLVPWGLLFDRHPDKDIDHLSESELREGFWCVKHDVCAIFPSNYQESPWARPNLLIEPKKLIATIHSAAEQFAIDTNPKGSRWQFGSVCRSQREFDRLLRLHRNGDHWFFYFFCHARPNQLVIDTRRPDEPLTPELVQFWLNGMENARGLFFLNGCDTGVSYRREEGGVTWLEATRNPGFLGFVGTEAIIPTRFAWRIGRDFLRLLIVDQRTPLEAMRWLRSFHWPLSLLYALYCVPDALIAATEPIAFPEARTTNHCEEEMGEGLAATLPFLEER